MTLPGCPQRALRQRLADEHWLRCLAGVQRHAERGIGGHHNDSGVVDVEPEVFRHLVREPRHVVETVTLRAANGEGREQRISLRGAGRPVEVTDSVEVGALCG